jgi:hypothetical protein
MPKTMTFDRHQLEIIRKLLRTELKRAQNAVEREEGKAKEKNLGMLPYKAREALKHRDLVAGLLQEAQLPVMVTRRNLLSGKVPTATGTLLLNLAGASAPVLFRSGSQFKNNAQGSRANENKGLDCADYTCVTRPQDDRINALLIRFTWNTRRRRRRSRCLDPKG